MPRSSIIGIDGSRLAVGERTGTETYTFQLLAALARLNPPDPIRIYLNAARAPADLPQIGEPVGIPFPRLWTHLRLSGEMIRRAPGVLFVPAHVVPAWHPRTVVTIHDVGYLAEPESHPAGARRMLHGTTRWSVRVARRVIAISETTRRAVVEHYGASPDRVSVVFHGVDPSFRPASPEAIAELRHRLRLPERYVLALGTVQPRKNLVRLAAAMQILGAAGFPHRLVIAGKRGWLADTVEQGIAGTGLADRIVLLGYVASEDLPALYSAADVFCFPSLYEGFGLPALEAMACAVPTVVSARGALPEVAGQAALTVDPLDVEAIGAALRAVVTREELRGRLIERGRQRAAAFSWDRAAAETLAILRAVRDEQG